MAPTRSRLLLIVLAACSEVPPDECPELGVRCDGNVAESCVLRWDDELRSHRVLVREDCGAGVCALPPANAEGLAFCALEAGIDPRSPSALRDRRDVAGCVDGVLTTWSYGLRTGATVCEVGTCIDSAATGFDPTCVGTAFCSPLPDPDSACTGRRGTACADDTTIVYCACNYRVEAHACAAPGPHCLEEPLANTEQTIGVCR